MFCLGVINLILLNVNRFSQEEELHSTSHNYEEQMSVLTEHVAGLNEQLARQHDEIQQLKHTLHNRRK